MARIDSYLQVMSADLSTLLQQDVALIDIRRPEEWRMTGVVSGSHLLTFFDASGNCQPQQWLAELERLIAPQQGLVLICRTGHRTSLICELIIELSQRRPIYNVTDGIFGWLAQGLPVVSVETD